MTVSAWLTSPPGDLDEYCVWVRQYLAARGILYSTQLLHQRETFLVDLRAAYEGWRDTSPDITQRLSVTASSKVFEDRIKILRAAVANAASSAAAAANHTAAARDDSAEYTLLLPGLDKLLLDFVRRAYQAGGHAASQRSGRG